MLFLKIEALTNLKPRTWAQTLANKGTQFRTLLIRPNSKSKTCKPSNFNKIWTSFHLHAGQIHLCKLFNLRKYNMWTYLMTLAFQRKSSMSKVKAWFSSMEDLNKVRFQTFLKKNLNLTTCRRVCRSWDNWKVIILIMLSKLLFHPFLLKTTHMKYWKLNSRESSNSINTCIRSPNQYKTNYWTFQQSNHKTCFK